jgi:hypothetical protein
VLARALGSTLVVFSLLTACGVEEVNTPKLRPNASSSNDAGSDVQEAGSTPPANNAGTDAGVEAAASIVETYLSDMNLDVVNNGYGPLEKNMSCGEINAADGVAITIGGIVHQKGLGAHAPSEINVPLNGQYTIFIADVGVDDEVADQGSIVFQVIVDGETLFDSGTVTGNDAAKPVAVNVAGKQQMKLVVTDAGDGIGSDHADWGSARLRLK